MSLHFPPESQTFPVPFEGLCELFLIVTTLLPLLFSRYLHRIPRVVKWLELFGMLLFVSLLKLNLNYKQEWFPMNLISWILSTSVGIFVWRSRANNDDIILESFASGAIFNIIIEMRELRANSLDWIALIFKSVSEHCQELLQQGNRRQFFIIFVVFALGAHVSMAMVASPYQYFYRFLVFCTVDAFCALRACQCLENEPYIGERARKVVSLLAIVFVGLDI